MMCFTVCVVISFVVTYVPLPSNVDAGDGISHA